MRVALGGSAAAAAALALVVSTTRKVEHAPAARYEIETGKIAEKAQREAIARAEVARKAEAPAPAAAAPAPAELEVAAAPEPRPQAARKSAKAKAAVKDDQVQALLGSGGDAADELALHDSAVRAAPAASAGAGAAHGVVARTDAPAPVSTGARAEMKQLAKAAPAAADDVNAGTLESQAQEARHAGNYLLAASLYRKAAALRRSANAIALRQAAVGSDPGTAAWDLAHAVECLAAAGLFDEARQVRAELLGLYPSENTPITAANRALRAGDTPAAPVTAPDEKRPGTAPAVDH
jgi:tetratricopeptide (TPR) repeat protein